MVDAAVLAALLVGGWILIPESTRLELRTKKEALPDHAPVEAIWWSDDGTLAVAVGLRGEVLLRSAAFGDTAKWTRWPLDGGAELLAVAGGDGPAPDATSVLAVPVVSLRAFAVGKRGALVGCRDAACAPLDSHVTEDLRAVAVAGGQAIAVGHGGTVLHLQAGRGPRAGPSNPLGVYANVLHPDVPDTAILRAVALDCASDGWPWCTAVIVGERGVIVEGRFTGRCYDGSYFSGPSSCSWSWCVARTYPMLDLVAVSADAGRFTAFGTGGVVLQRNEPFTGRCDAQGDAPSWRLTADAGSRIPGEILAPVREVRTKPGRRREVSFVAPVRLARPTQHNPVMEVRREGLWTLLGGDVLFMAGASSVDGARALLVGEDGDVYLAD